MSLRINNNIAAVNGHRNLSKNTDMVNKSLERLSSGLKINRAADGAAGLIISEQMRAQLGGIDQAISNSEQAVTMVQTAEGALDEVSNLLSKARTLAVHAANEGVNDTNQLVADQGELDNIVDSVSRIASNTQFGTKKILDGSLSNGVSNSSAVDSVKLGGDYAAKLKLGGSAAGGAVKGYHSLEITQKATQANITFNITGSDVFTAFVTGAAATDKVQTTFTLAINGTKLTIASGSTRDQLLQQLNALGQSVGFTATQNTGTSQIQLRARDFGQSFDFDVQYVSGASGASLLNLTETAGVDATATLLLYTGANGDNGTAVSGASSTIAFSATGGTTYPGGNGLRLVSSGGSVLVLSTNIATGVVYGGIDGTTAGATFQIGANAGQTATVELASANSSQLGIGGSGTYSTLSALKGSSLTAGNAQEALKVIDKAIDDVTVIRGGLGAFQANTLETNVSSLRVTYENLTAAESTIRDTDFAAESSRFTKYNILVQSSTAMLAQANQMPQGVLKLLG